jgi:hypothetical protein
MPLCRMLFGGLARLSYRPLEDHNEKFGLLQEEELVTSQKAVKEHNGAHSKAQIQKSVLRGKRIVRNICNHTRHRSSASSNYQE